MSEMSISDKLKIDKAKEKLKQSKSFDDILQNYGFDPKERRDGWVNALSGLGGKMDKSSATQFGTFYQLIDLELAYMYSGDGISKSIIDTIADDMTREWIKINGDVDDKIKNNLDVITAQLKINSALKWTRLFGGCLVIIGALDGNDAAEPLNENNIKSVSWLNVIDRSDVQIERSIYNGDMRSPNFGKIEQYYVRVRTSNIEDDEQMIAKPGDPLQAKTTYSSTNYIYKYIHRSRVLEFFGEPLPREAKQVNEDLRYWGSSVLQSCWDKLRDLGGVMGHVSNIIYELVITVYRFSNLAEMLANGNEEQLVKRMEIINLYKSTINSVLIGEDEDVTQLTANLSNLPEIIDRFMMMLSAGTGGIPVTRLFGRSPAGQNATGESDNRIYYDDVRSDQRTKLEPQLNKLVRYIALSKENNIDPNSISIEFNPLMQMTPKEQSELDKMDAETHKLNAETDSIRMEQGVTDSTEIRSRYEEELEEDE